MKKLLKSRICGSMNRARVHYSPWKSQQMRAKKKRKKEEVENAENENTDA